ncbi:Putative protein of unknown function [Podospora comata]|uniref:Uncharacterized protein n=1 Tax=Podospora comata TaxID=48703 RepID=A0ABY6S855_PODCO|nr:Putative protein of unknown function [Podospora comata]
MVQQECHDFEMPPPSRYVQRGVCTSNPLARLDHLGFPLAIAFAEFDTLPKALPVVLHVSVVVLVVSRGQMISVGPRKVRTFVTKDDALGWHENVKLKAPRSDMSCITRRDTSCIAR